MTSFKTSKSTKQMTARARSAAAMFTMRIRRQEGYIAELVITIPRSDRVSTANGWKRILLENVSRINLNRFWLKRLIPIEHGLSVFSNFCILSLRNCNILTLLSIVFIPSAIMMSLRVK